MSELYKLPSGWKWKKLDEIGKVFSGSSAPQKDEYFVDGEYPFIRTRDLATYGRTCNLVDINDYINKKCISESKLILAKKGTILFPKSGASIGTNNRAMIGLDSYIVSHLGAFYSNNETTNNYIYNYFLIIDLLKYCENPSYPSLKISRVKDIKIPIPPLSEQQRIVSKLNDIFEKIDKSIALHKKNIGEANVFMGSVLNEVFNQFIEKYNLKTIESFSKVGTGVTPLKSKTQYYENGNINWITSKATNFDFVNNCEQLVTNIAISECRLKIYPIGTIIVALYGQGKTRGQVSELMIETATNQAIATIVVDDNQAINRYLKYFLKKSYLDLRRKASGGTQANLNLTIIKNIELPLPPLNIQQKVVAHLDKISEKIEKIKSVQKEKMESLVALKASILDQAFRGKL